MSKAIILSFNTSDQEALTRACDYWALNDDGKWLNNIDHLTDLHRLNRKLLLNDVNRAASAFDLSSRCYRCNTPSVATSRTNVGKFQGFKFRRLNSKSLHLCSQCDEYVQDLIQTQVEIQRQKQKEEAVAFIDELNAENIKETVDSLTLKDAVYFYSLLESSDVTEDGFNQVESFCLMGKISGSDLIDERIMGHLYKRGLIKLSKDTSSQAINRSSKKASINFIMARWQITDFFDGASYAELMMQLSEIISSLTPLQEEIQELWEVVALSECQGKLLYEAKQYRFSNYLIGEKTNHALLYVLKDYAIPRAWSIIQSVCKQIAADVQSGRLPAYMAHTYVPNSLIRFADRATEQQWNVYGRSRENWNAEAPLTSIFFNRLIKNSGEGFRTLTSASLKQNQLDGPAQEQAFNQEF